MLEVTALLVLLIALAALWWAYRQGVDRARHSDTTADRETWSGVKAEVDGIRFDRSKDRIELWRRTP